MDSTAARWAELMTKTRSADRASSGVSARERWAPRSYPSAAATRTLARRLARGCRGTRRTQLHEIRVAPELGTQRRDRKRTATGVAGAHEEDAERWWLGRHVHRG